MVKNNIAEETMTQSGKPDTSPSTVKHPVARKFNPTHLTLVSALIPPVGLIIALVIWFKWPQNRSLARWLAILSVLLAIIYGAIALNRPSNSYNYKYKQLTTQEYTGKGTSIDMKFSQPSEFATATTETPNYKAFSHVVKVNGKDTIIGGTFMTSINLTKSQVNQEVAAVNSDMTKSVNDSNPPIAAGLASLARVWLPDGETIHITGGRALTTPNIAKNAWEFDFTGTSTNKAVAPNIQGEFIYALTDHGEFIFELYSATQSWSSNSAIWQQTINSLQFDQ